jgi:hypothetical protein
MKKIQKSNFHKKLLICTISTFLAATGCSSSPHLIEKYPDFLQKKDHISSIAICTDVLVVFDGVESGVVIDIPLSLIAGDSILSIFKRELEKKNYQIGEIYPTAVGYSLSGDEIHYRVFENEEDYSLNTDSLKMMSAPFVIGDEFYKLEDVWNKKDRHAGAVSAGDSSKIINQDQEGEYLLYAYLEAQNVSVSKRISEGLLTTVLTLGLVTSGPTARASLYYWLYDLKTSNVVLSDGRIMTGPDLTGENVADLLEEMLEEIPPKGM